LKYKDTINHTQAILQKIAYFHGQKDSREFSWWDVASKRDGYIRWGFV